MSERLRRAYERKEEAERKARIQAADPTRHEQRLMGELFKHNNPGLYPPPGPPFRSAGYEAGVFTRGYMMPRKAREELTARGLLPS